LCWQGGESQVATIVCLQWIVGRLMQDLQALLKQTGAMHNHLCPRQVLGVRTGMYAAVLFGLDLPQDDKRLFAFVETDGCYADGLSVATGCWLGRRTLRLMDYGKVAVTLVDTCTGLALRISPSLSARERAVEHAPQARTRWQAQLLGYQRMALEKLLHVQEVRLTLSLERIISKPGLRARCEECDEEVMNEREVLVEGRVLCKGCARVDTYFLPLSEPYDRLPD
jgi:formylmethanofuran dehydrogenase subunit E